MNAVRYVHTVIPFLDMLLQNVVSTKICLSVKQIFVMIMSKEKPTIYFLEKHSKAFIQIRDMPAFWEGWKVRKVEE